MGVCVCVGVGGGGWERITCRMVIIFRGASLKRMFVVVSFHQKEEALPAAQSGDGLPLRSSKVDQTK